MKDILEKCSLKKVLYFQSYNLLNKIVKIIAF